MATISKKLNVLGILVRRLFMPPIEKLILRNILKKGRTYPGDVVKDLGISQAGLKKILELKRKGYLIREDDSSCMRINPSKRKVVKIMTG